MSAAFHISNEQARALILAQSGLAGVRQEGGAAAVAPLIRKLGYVQLDSIRMIERAHHHILFSRHSAYRPRHLEKLQSKTPVLFEHWTHDASLIPMEFYPHWRHRFAKTRANIAEWRKDFGDERVLKTVRDHIADKGPSLARDFAHLGGRTGPWWGWGPAKSALEFLWRTGELAVLQRDGFEKIYDLAERAIPKADRTGKPTKAQTLDWAFNDAVDRLGAGTARMISDFWKHGSIPEAAVWIAREKKAGRLIDVVLEGAKDKRGFAAVARPSIEAHLAKLLDATGRLRVLSPFDPVLRDRARAERIFGFDYRIEIFYPEHKRQYGYYVFPLLEGDRFVGRIDMKANRAGDNLAVKALWMENRLSLTPGRRAKLMRELERQAKLATVRDILFPAAALKTS